MLGFVPGPAMMSAQLDLSLTLLLIVVVGNAVGAILCLSVSQYLARVAFIPSRILFPVVMCVTFLGAFAYRGMLEDIVVTLIFGILGLAMRNLGFNRPALFLGYILGGLFEQNLLIGIGTSGPLLFLRPVAVIAILIVIGVLNFDFIRTMFDRWVKKGARNS